MTGSTKACIFCGAVGVKLTKEHAYPRWLYRGLGLTGPIRFSSDPAPIRVTAEFDMTVRGVCVGCNNGWLHDLERAFRATMLGALRGVPVDMSRPVQQVAAVWAVKTWELVERSTAYMRDGHIPPNDGLLGWLRTYNEPPDDTQVWIGAVDAQQDHLVTFVATKTVSEGGVYAIGVCGIITIGNLLFQVYVPAIVEGVDERIRTLSVRGPLARYLIPIWPHQFDEVRWPPPAIMSPADLERFWPNKGLIRPIRIL